MGICMFFFILFPFRLWLFLPSILFFKRVWCLCFIVFLQAVVSPLAWYPCLLHGGFVYSFWFCSSFSSLSSTCLLSFCQMGMMPLLGCCSIGCGFPTCLSSSVCLPCFLSYVIFAWLLFCRLKFPHLPCHFFFIFHCSFPL